MRTPAEPQPRQAEPRPRAADRARGAGLRSPASGPAAERRARSPRSCGAARRAPARLGQRVHAGALHAGVLAPRPLRPLAAGSHRRTRRGADRPPAGRVLGARGVADPARAPPAASLADGRRGPRGVGVDLAGGPRASPELVADTLELVAREGPIRARDTGAVRSAPRPGHMWNWHEGKVALEHLFFTGRVGAARRVNFERRYDTIERVLPPEILDAADAERARRAARAGADRRAGSRRGHRAGPRRLLPPPSRRTSKARVAELVAAGELEPVEVEGWSAPAYLWPGARQPAALDARALLSPFDSLIWFRPRTERLFGFRYRIEIYTPAAKRVHGYYVLPFLLGEELVARVDLKSDRDRGRPARPGRVRRGRRRSRPRGVRARGRAAARRGLARASRGRGRAAREPGRRAGGQPGLISKARWQACPRRLEGSLLASMSDSRVTPGVIYKAILLAFGLVIGAMIFRALSSLVLGVLIVVIIATPLSAFADLLAALALPAGDRGHARAAARPGRDRRAGGADRARVHPRGERLRALAAVDRRFARAPAGPADRLLAGARHRPDPALRHQLHARPRQAARPGRLDRGERRRRRGRDRRGPADLALHGDPSRSRS